MEPFVVFRLGQIQLVCHWTIASYNFPPQFTVELSKHRNSIMWNKTLYDYDPGQTQISLRLLNASNTLVSRLVTTRSTEKRSSNKASAAVRI